MKNIIVKNWISHNLFFYQKITWLIFLINNNINKKLSRMRLVLYYIENLTSRKMKSIVTRFFNFVKNIIVKNWISHNLFFYQKITWLIFLINNNINKKLSRMRLVLYYIENLTSRKMKSIGTWFFNFVKISYKKLSFT